MKRLIKYLILLAVFLIALYGSNATEEIGIINDEFFTHPDTIVSFRSLIPHADGYMAVIDGTTTDKTKSASVKPFWKSIFVHHDEKKDSDELIEGTVLCGTRTLERSMTLKRSVPYLFVRDCEETTGTLVIGGTVTYNLVKEYARPDKSIFREIIKPLYDLRMSREGTAAHDVTVCRKEWTITSQWQRKTRHMRDHYSAIDIYHVITKFPCAAGMLTCPPPEEMSRTFFRKELRYKSQEAETPECGTNGGNLPLGSIII